MKILVRYYSNTNLGDDLFIKMLLERYPEHEFLIPTYGTSRLGFSLPNMKEVHFPVAHKWFSAFGRLIGYANAQLLFLSFRADAMVYIGGSIFMEPKVSRTWRREYRFYRSLKIPYFIVGANVGPYRTVDFLPILKQIFEGAEDVCLRDSTSYELVRDVSTVRLATDIVFGLDTKSYAVKAVNKVIISAIDAYKKFDSRTAARYEMSLASFADKVVNSGFEVVFMSFCDADGDAVANKRIMGMMSGDGKKITERNYNGDLNAALREIASCKVIVASRFHATILGLVFDKKVLPLAYSDKTTDILTDINFSGKVVQIKDIGRPDFLKDFTVEEIPSADIAAQVNLAGTQFASLSKFLENEHNVKTR